MSRVVLVIALALAAGACTADEPATVAAPSTTVAPLTTLPPAGSSTTVTTSTIQPSSTTTTTAPPPENECVVGTDTSTEGYAIGCDVLGFRILAGEDVDATAVEAEAERVYEMLLPRPDLAASLLDSHLEGRIVPVDARITALPEYADLYDQYPGTDWRRRGRSFPGTELVPYFSGAEENLLCLDDDFYGGEDIFVRTFAQTIKRFGLDIVDPATSRAIEQSYARAIAEGLWVNTLAEIDAEQYWMEGTQSFFDANLEDTSEEREPNSSHNAVNTRDELREYDPALWTILVSVYGDGDWRPSCP